VKENRDIINKENLLIVRDLIQKRTGIFFPESKILTLEKSIYSNYLESMANNFNEYILCLSSKNGDSYFRKLISFLTTNETYFFRGKADFDILKNIIFPELIKRKSSNHRTISIWSAACSTGEEPYSLAIILKELIPKIETWKINIIASDIDETAISTARKGEYSQWSFRGVDTATMNKYFYKKGDTYKIKEDYKTLINFISRVFPVGIVYQKATNGAAKNKTTPELISIEKKQVKETDKLLNIIKKSTPSLPKISDNLNLHEHRNNLSEEKIIFNEAIKYYTNNNYDFAIDRFFKVLDINPKNVRASWMLCHISANRGHFEDAIKWGTRCIEIDPLFKEAYYSLALINLERKEYNEAVEKLKKVIYIDPNFTLGYFTLGNIYTLMYLHSQATDCFKIAIDILSVKPSDEIVFQAEHLTVKELLNLIELKFRAS